ncbi:hypothetical protein [Gloeothece verrucosa]|nr:hypothetical protein [Gloeothece verrucosa]
MSSPPTNPYQSRLLNLFNRQSLRLKEQLNRTGRQLKNAVEMGVQILVYPLYLLVQTGRMVQRQLQQKIAQQQFLLSPSSSNSGSVPVTCDQPIEQILKTLEPWLSEAQDTISPSAVSAPLEKVPIEPFSQNIEIQGLATLLQNQKLVLVSSNNLLIDIFYPAQQEQLKQRIVSELANYQYQRRLELQAAKKFPSLIPSFQINSPQVLPPVRWFWTVMRWIQTGELANAINLFGESTLVRRSGINNITVSTTLTEPIKSIPRETQYQVLTSIETLDHYSVNLGRIQVIIQAALEYFFGERKAERVEQKEAFSLKKSPTDSMAYLAHWGAERVPHGETAALGNTDISPQLLPPTDIHLTIKGKREQLTQKPLTLTPAESDPFQIQILIQAAIDYFFGQTKKQLLGGGNPNRARLSTPSRKPLSQEPEPDPWLSKEDLFSENIPRENPKKPNDGMSSEPAKLAGTSREIKSKKSLLETFKQTLTQENKAQSLTLEKPLPTPAPSPLNEAATAKNLEITPISAKVEELEAKPEWIETEATPVGYVKHPLVKILETLDRVIFWLEEQGLKFWNWVRGNKNSH